MKYTLSPSEVIAMGRKYKNYQEKRKLGTRDQMWDFHWAAGSKNYTIWAMLYKDYTGASYQGQAWCAMYGTDVVALTFKNKYGLSDAEAAAATKEYFGGDMPFNCQGFVNNHKNDKRLTHKPSLGAHVMFWTGGKYGHWGLVTGVDAKGFTSVEGNTSGGSNKIDPDGGAVVEKWHANDSRHYFYHPDYSDNTTPARETYKVGTGVNGLTILAKVLNIRNNPGNGAKIGTYKYGDIIRPLEKCFVNHSAWYRTEKGWSSAAYVEGWVQEADGQWWYVHKGYTFTVNNWEQIDGNWYYMNDTGYILTNNWLEWKGKWYYFNNDGVMVTNTYIKSVDKDLWYWLDASGVWNPNDPNYTTDKNPNA